VKKAAAVFILFLISLPLWAQEDELPATDTRRQTTTWNDEEQEPPPKERFALKNRIFEISLANFDVGFSNSFLAANYVIRDPDDMGRSGMFFRDSVSINLNDFLRGFTFKFGAIIKPLSLNFNWKDKWGFGLDIGHVNVTGNLLLSGNLLSFNEASDDKFGLGAAVFADFSIPVFFHINEIKIKIRPSAFLPVVYTEPDITYNYRQTTDPATGDSSMRMRVNYDMRVYSIVGMQGFENNDFSSVVRDLQDNARDIAKNNLGYDFSLGAEYPLYDRLDIGVDFINIPLVMAGLTRYMRIEGEAFFDTGKIDIPGLINGENIPDDAYGYPKDIKIQYGNDGAIKIYRPFTMLFYAKYRPFESRVFSLAPSLGLSVNSLYAQPVSIEGGLSARLDLANIFIAAIGINYNDRIWKNGLDFVLNLRAFELDFGISFQSSDFAKSFQGAGFGAAAGIKLGW